MSPTRKKTPPEKFTAYFNVLKHADRKVVRYAH